MFSFQKYKEFERAVRVDEIDGLRLVKRLADDMEEMFHKKAEAMKVFIYLNSHPSSDYCLKFLRIQQKYF